METQEVATYLVKTYQFTNQISLTMHVHEGDLNGTLLSGLQVTGQDAAGNNLEGVTDSKGVLSISGQPGTWKLTLENDGYNTLNSNYDVMETQEAAAYLIKTAQSQGLIKHSRSLHLSSIQKTVRL